MLVARAHATAPTIPLLLPSNPFAGRPDAEATQRAIDEEVARLLREAQAQATKLRTEERDALDRVIKVLLERETIDGAPLAAVVGRPMRHTDHERIWAPRAVAMTKAPPSNRPAQ